MPPFEVTIVIPLWNEAENVEALVEMLSQVSAVRHGQGKVILVNNGSIDRTGDLAAQMAMTRAWLKVVHLPANLNYGGGILQGCRQAETPYLCFIPGDLQYAADDVDRVLKRLEEHHAQGRGASILVKGSRRERRDGAAASFVSSTYTLASNAVLRLGVRDVNGLPKAFHRALLEALPPLAMHTFVLDAQLLYCARLSGWEIDEVNVTFHRRAAGKSSWSGKRIRVYLKSLGQLFQVRHRGARQRR